MAARALRKGARIRVTVTRKAWTIVAKDRVACEGLPRTDGDRAAEAEVGSARQVRILVLAQDGSQRPVALNDRYVYPRKVARYTDNSDHDADSSAIIICETISEQERLD